METLARRCRGEWSTHHLAVLLAPADGGKPCWHVREDADARFARGAKSPDLLPIDWSKLNDKQRATVHRRNRLLHAWLDARLEDFSNGFSERESTAAFVARSKDDRQGVLRGSLFRWFKAFQAAGPSGLVDARHVTGINDPAGDPFVEELKRLFLKSRGYTKAMCYSLACEKAEDKGWSIPFGDRQAFNILTAIPKKVASYHRDGVRER